jgi:hypothetical protein
MNKNKHKKDKKLTMIIEESVLIGNRDEMKRWML